MTARLLPRKLLGLTARDEALIMGGNFLRLIGRG
jgi:hypothetical protein